MKKVFIFLFMLAAFLPLARPAPKNPGKPVITVFYSTHCGACLRLQAEILPKLKAKYGDKVQWQELAIDVGEENLSFLLAAASRLRNEGPATPAVLVGNTLLVGLEEINPNAERLIDQAIAQGPVKYNWEKADLLQEFKKFSLWAVVAAGLIDGINPCAFAVIVFFISFLTIYGYKKREIVCIGSAYCLAVFLTYLFMGMGLFRVFYMLSNIHSLIKAFYYFVAGFCFVLFGLAFYDYYKYMETGISEDMTLQLPKFLKKRINLTIGTHLRQARGLSILSLVTSAFIVGFLVSLLEAACTGQVYVPTIVYIMKTTNMKIKAFSYLVVYNLMFIAPLIGVFVLSLAGVSSQKFTDFLKRNLAGIKLLMALLFLVLGVLILKMSLPVWLAG